MLLRVEPIPELTHRRPNAALPNKRPKRNVEQQKDFQSVLAQVMKDKAIKGA